MNQNITRLASVRNGLRLVALSLTFSGFAGPSWGGLGYLEGNLLQLGKAVESQKRPESEEGFVGSKRSRSDVRSRKYFVVFENGQKIGNKTRKGTLKEIDDEVKAHKVAFSSFETTFEGGFPLVDYKVEDADGKDVVYEKSPRIREFLPRGLAVVRDENSYVVHELVGLRKFGYDWSYVTENQIGDAESINLYAMAKENGSAAHIGAFEKDGQLFWVIGSKNVHQVVPHDVFEAMDDKDWSDSKNYSFGARGKYAENITYLWRQTWASLNDTQKKDIRNKMTQEKVTFVGEAIFRDDQHLKRYFNDNHSTQGDILFFAMTASAPLEDGLLVHPPQEGLDLFAGYGLKRVGDLSFLEDEDGGAPMFRTLSLKPSEISFEDGRPIIRSKDYTQLVQDVARMKDSEGVALYMTVVGQDKTERTVDLRKCKAADYTLMGKVRGHVVDGRLFGGRGITETLENSVGEFDPDQQSIIQEVLKTKEPFYEALVNFFKQLPEGLTRLNKKGKKFFTESAQKAFCSQWVSIEEQFRDDTLTDVTIKMDGQSRSFEKGNVFSESSKEQSA